MEEEDHDESEVVEVTVDEWAAMSERSDAERKVIEAAKAWTDDDDRHPRYAQLLMLAVDQLRALEAEEE